MSYQGVNPYDGRLLHTFAEQSDEQLEAAMAPLKPGDPMDPATTLGPLSSEAALLTLVDRALAAGATAVIGDRRIGRPGSFMQPTILAGITRDNAAFDEEFFRPVALFFRVADEDAAVALANGSPFRQEVAMTRKRGTCVLGGLPPGEFPVPSFDVVANCITVRGSFTGTRQDMAEALAFAAKGKDHADIELQPLPAINAVLDLGGA